MLRKQRSGPDAHTFERFIFSTSPNPVARPEFAFVTTAREVCLWQSCVNLIQMGFS